MKGSHITDSLTLAPSGQQQPDRSVTSEFQEIGTHSQLLIGLLKQASLISRPMIEGVSTPNGLSANELRLMMCLGGEGPLAGHEIADVMGMQPMNVSRAIATLVKRGWLAQVGDPKNRRRRPVMLSEAGWLAYRAMMPDVRIVAEYLLGALTANERLTLGRVTAKIEARMADWHIEHMDGDAA